MAKIESAADVSRALAVKEEPCAVREAPLVPEPVGEAGREPSSQDRVAHDQGRIVGVVVAERQPQAREVGGVCLVGSQDRVALGLQTGLVRPLDPRIRLLGLPGFERLGHERQDLRRFEVADDREFAVPGTEELLVERLDLVEAARLDAIDLLVDGRRVADVIGRIRCQDPREPDHGQRLGLGARLLEPGELSVLRISNSLAGRVGSRSTWRSTSSTAGSADSPGLDRDAERARTDRGGDSRARFRSSVSWICCRESCFVPRIIRCGRNEAASTRPFRFSALP